MSSYRAKLRRSVRQEKSIATAVGGRRVAGSGSQPGNKGDVRTERWLIEAKQTVKPSYRLTLDVWRKIEHHAIKAGREPVLIVEMAGRSLAVMDLNAFLAVKDY